MSLSIKTTEFQEREELENRQIKLIQKLINCNKNKSKIIVKTKSDINQIPFTEKINSITDLTKSMVKKNYSRNELKVWFETILKNLFASTINSHDIVQIAYNPESQIGYGFCNGLRKMGSSYFYVPEQDPQYQIEKIQQNKSNALISSSSMVIKIIEKIKELKMNTNKLSLKKGLFSIESFPEDTRINILLNSDISTFFFLGLSEIYNPGIAFECLCKNGLHINENLLYAEIIDPITGMNLEDGIKGELVLTTLSKMKFPLIRYKTKIMASIEKNKCLCNRITSRIIL